MLKGFRVRYRIERIHSELPGFLVGIYSESVPFDDDVSCADSIFCTGPPAYRERALRPQGRSNMSAIAIPLLRKDRSFNPGQQQTSADNGLTS